MLTGYWVSDLMTEQDTGCFGTEMPLCLIQEET